MKTNYSPEIEAVHHEFENAADIMYDKMKRFINRTTIPNKEKADRLERLGFTKSKPVVRAKKITAKINESEKSMSLIQYFKQHYPFNKYITEDSVKSICKKYGLVCGDVSDFKGFIPDSKITEMESFRLREDDYKEESPIWSALRSYIVYMESSPDPFVDNKGKNKKYCPPFKICAPVKDFDMTSKDVKEYKVVNKPVPDPVVLQPVKDGYLIVCAWGDEASDPIVINEINN